MQPNLPSPSERSVGRSDGLGRFGCIPDYAPGMASAPDSARLAVLIDGDNTTPTIIEALLAEIAKYGSATVKRAYGDWTTPNLRGWKEAINAHAIQPMQQFAYTTGKNATDSALIIDAMDLLYTGNLDGFCLVSSDSDFTKLASRLREAGKTVYGFGEPKTPRSLVAERARRLRLTEPVYGLPRLPQPGGELGEVAVGGNQAETVQVPGVEEVHRVDDQRAIGGVLAGGVGELLQRLDRMGVDRFLPSPEVW